MLTRFRAAAAFVIAAAAVATAAAPPVLNESLSGRQVFPVDNWWNLDVSQAPVDPRSAQLIGWISGRAAANPNAVRQLHPDFGPPPYGIPYVVVAGDQARVQVTFDYDDESDYAIGGLSGYPIPSEAITQQN